MTVKKNALKVTDNGNTDKNLREKSVNSRI